MLVRTLWMKYIKNVDVHLLVIYTFWYTRLWARLHNCEKRQLASSRLSVRPSVRLSVCLSPFTNSAPPGRISWSWYLIIFWKFVDKIKVSLKPDNSTTVQQYNSSGILHEDRGTRWCSWLRYCAIRRKVTGSIPDGDIEIFLWHNPSGRPHCGPRVDSARNRNEYQEYFLGVKAAGA